MEAAFFDLDKTVIARSATLAMGRPLLQEGLISRGQVLRGLYAQLVYHLVGADEDQMEKMREALLALSRGWEREKLEAIIERTVEEHLEPVIFAEALALIREHRAAGRRVYLVSSSGEEIVRALARVLGVPHVIATRARVDAAGRLTGELDFYCFGENKAAAMREHAERFGIDLSASYAYSDSVTDLPMLEAVGHPHAVNPDRELQRAAAERGWPVLRFASPVAPRARLRTHARSPAAGVLVGVAVLAALLGWVRFRRTTGRTHAPPA